MPSAEGGIVDAANDDDASRIDGDGDRVECAAQAETLDAFAVSGRNPAPWLVQRKTVPSALMMRSPLWSSGKNWCGQALT